MPPSYKLTHPVGNAYSFLAPSSDFWVDQSTSQQVHRILINASNLSICCDSIVNVRRPLILRHALRCKSGLDSLSAKTGRTAEMHRPHTSQNHVDSANIQSSKSLFRRHQRQPTTQIAKYSHSTYRRPVLSDERQLAKSDSTTFERFPLTRGFTDGRP